MYNKYNLPQQYYYFVKVLYSIIFILSLVGCSVYFGSTSQPTYSSKTISPPNISSVTPILTLTVIPTLSPTATPTPKPIQIGSLGRGVISEIVHSPDGRVIAIGIGSTLRWFDGATFSEIGKLDLGLAGIMTIHFSLDSQFVGVESGLSEAQVVDLDRQVILASIQGSNGPISDMSFTPDSRYVAFLMQDMTPHARYDTIGLWNMSTSQIERVFDVIDANKSHGMSGPAISPDGKLLAAGSTDKRVYLWDLASGQTRFVFEGHTEEITSVAFSPDGKFLASGSRDKTVRLWNISTRGLVKVISGMSDNVSEVSFSSDGKQIKIITNNFGLKSTYIWNLDTKKLSVLDMPETSPDPFAVNMHRQGFSQSWLPDTSGYVLFSPDGHTLALGSEPVLLWDLSTRTVTNSLENMSHRLITDMQYSPDGRWLATKDDLGNLKVWNVITGETQIQTEREGSPNNSVQVFAFSQNSTLLALASQDAIELWDVASAKQISTIKMMNQGTRSIIGLAFSPDGGKLHVVLFSNNIQATETWEIATGKLLHHFELPVTAGYVFGTTDTHWPYFARNNANQNKSWIEVWNLETEQIVFQLETPRPETEPIHFSLDGKFLIAISNSHLLAWNTVIGHLIFDIDHVEIGSGVAISSDNQMLAIEDSGQIALWDISQVTRNIDDR